jgi:hypothetical protein
MPVAVEIQGTPGWFRGSEFEIYLEYARCPVFTTVKISGFCGLLGLNAVHIHVCYFCKTDWLADWLTDWPTDRPTDRPSSQSVNKLYGTESFLRRCHSASQDIPCPLWNPKVHYCVHISLPLVPILIQIDPVHTLPPCFPKIHSNVIFPSTSKSSEWSRAFSSCVTFRNKPIFTVRSS